MQIPRRGIPAPCPQKQICTGAQCPKLPLFSMGILQTPSRSATCSSCNLTFPEILGIALSGKLGRTGNGSCYSQVLAVQAVKPREAVDFTGVLFYFISLFALSSSKLEVRHCQEGLQQQIAHCQCCLSPMPSNRKSSQVNTARAPAARGHL